MLFDAKFLRGWIQHPSAWLASLAMLTVVAGPLLAEVQVTLKSGASLVGNASMDGKDVVVKIDDSELRVPLTEVEAITSVDAGPERQARRLLLTALELRVDKGDGGNDIIGLLSEAARLAPDDPQIAFWYASSLADAGYGQAANDILSKKQEAIAAVYPGLAEKLAARIKQRMALEMLPPTLLARLDELNASPSKGAATNDLQHLAVMFRLVDQHKQPIERSAFHIYSNNGQDDNLEVFDDGYYLFTFKRHRGNQPQPTKLDIVRPGLEAKSFELPESTSSVRDAGELVAKRYEEAEKVAVRVNVTDGNRKPIVGARVTFHPTSPRGGGGDQSVPVQTDAEGWAEAVLFPMSYNFNVHAEGFNQFSGQVELKPGGDTVEQSHQLYRLIEATIRLAWEASGVQGGEKTSGDATIHVGTPGSQPHHGNDPASWLRAEQRGDKLSLQFIDQFFGYGGPFGQLPEGWVRVIDEQADLNATEKESTGSDASKSDSDEAKPEDDAADAAADAIDLDAFNKLELEKVDEFKAKLPQPRMMVGGEQHGPRPPILLEAQTGKIYVGRLQHRDPRNGQPVQLAFKVFVEEMSTADEGE